MHQLIKTTKDFFIRNIWLGLVLFLAFGARLYGIYFDYPYTDFIWDETYSISYLFDLLTQKTVLVNPPSSTYPTLLPFLLAPVFVLRLGYIALMNGLHSIAELKNFIVMNGLGQIHIISRWYSVFFGTATVYLVYGIIRRIYRKRSVALYTALVYSFSLVPVYLSHWGKHHATMVFFVILSLLFVIIFEEKKVKKYVYFSMFAAAAAFSVHYIGATAVVFPFWAWWSNRRDFNNKEIIKCILFFGGIGAFFYLSNFYGVKSMLHQIIFDYYAKNDWGGIVPTGRWERFYYVFRDSFMIEPIFTALFFALGLKFKRLIKNNRLWGYIFAGLLFNYLLMITIIVGAHLSRWLLTFITLITLVSASLFYNWLLERSWRKEIKIFLAIIFILPNVYFTIHWLGLLRNNTALEAEAWLENNVKKDEYIYSFMISFNAPLSLESMEWNYHNNDRFRNMRKIVLVLENKERFRDKKGLAIMYDDRNNRYDNLAGEKTKYIIADGGSIKDLEKTRRELEKYHALELVRSFYPTENIEITNEGLDNDYLNSPEKLSTLYHLDKSGPFIDIYKVKGDYND